MASSVAAPFQKHPGKGFVAKVGVVDPDRRLFSHLGALDCLASAELALLLNPAKPERECHVFLVVAPEALPASAIRIVEALRHTMAGTPVIFSTNRSSEDLILQAFHAGAADYVRETTSPDTVARVVRRFTDAAGIPHMTGSSGWVEETERRIWRLSQSNSNVLITGESGTGKDLVARMVHAYSGRRERPLICVNCAAIPESLLESELFGYEKGAFTGADRTVEGKFQAAHGGTMFFDEIGDLSLYAQAKLLRTIENKEVQQLGAKHGSIVDVRVVAATNRDLEAMAAKGEFRKDLFYRLDVARIHLDPLRERKDDIPVLLRHFVSEFNARFGCTVRSVSRELETALMEYQWPGNIRELRNLLEAVFVNMPPAHISLEDIPQQCLRRLTGRAAAPAGSCERERIVAALTATHWNKTKAAETMHWSRMTLYRKMVKYRLLHPSE